MTNFLWVMTWVSQDNLCPWTAPLGTRTKCLGQRFPVSDLIRDNFYVKNKTLLAFWVREFNWAQLWKYDFKSTNAQAKVKSFTSVTINKSMTEIFQVSPSARYRWKLSGDKIWTVSYSLLSWLRPYWSNSYAPRFNDTIHKKSIIKVLILNHIWIITPAGCLS